MIRWIFLFACLAAFAIPNSQQDPAWNAPVVSAGGGGGGGTVTFENQSSDTSTGSVTSRTVSHTITNTLSGGWVTLTVVYFDSARTLGTVTFDGATMTQLGTQTDTSSGRLAMYGLAIGNKASGTYNAVVNWSGGTVDEWSIGVMSGSGANQSTTFGTTVKATGTSTTPSVTATSAANELVVDGVSMYHSAFKTAGSGQTKRWDSGASSTENGAGSTEAGAASVVMDWSLNFSGEWMIIATPVKP